MIRWNNDYNHGAHPAIIEAFARENNEAFGGYGMDTWCEKASGLIKEQIGKNDCDVHFLIGGTQVNFTVIAAALRPYQSVISPNSGHIHVHETGAVENTGHKIQSLHHKNGKITAEQIRNTAESFHISDIQEHITMPKLVFISFPTEYGTIYSKKELLDIRAVCDEYNLFLHIDGARLGYGLGAPDCDVTIRDIAALADSFYIGGTKCGAMFGEAVVLSHPEIRECFRSYMKQNGAMLAKGWTIGLQFYTLLKDNLYYNITKQADLMAEKIQAAAIQKGLRIYIENSTNQKFIVLSEAQMKKLGEKHIFEYTEPAGEGLHCVRFCTSWSTVPSDVEILVQDILAL